MKGIRIQYILLIISSMTFLSSCESALDQAPDGKISYDDVFADNDKVSAYLNTCYSYLPSMGNLYFFFSRGPACWSDEAWDADDLDVGYAASARYYNGDATASDFPAWGGTVYNNNGNYWSSCFEGIHDCSYFLQRIGKATVTSESDRSRWTAEAHLLRAYYYSTLLKWFGCGLPLISSPYNYWDDFSKVKRASYYETVKFIIADCDTALTCEDLPWRITTSAEAGRFPKALAWAIKSRMILYAASPLYSDSADHWQEAYTIDKEALDSLKVHGYELYNALHDKATYFGADSYFGYTGYPDSLKEKAAMYNEYFCTPMEYTATPNDKETIYESTHTSLSTDVEGIGSQHGYKTGACPSQELVDCFNTLDGQPILNLTKPYLDEETHLEPNYNTANTMYNSQDPYKNRDPRFYAYIYYNGSQRKAWWSFAETTASPENYPASIGYRVRKIMTYIGEPRTGTSSSGRTTTRTGYYLRKFIKPNTGDNKGSSECGFKEYRLAEVILNFAEAAAHAGHTEEAIKAVNEIRERAGMPDLPSGLSGDDLLNRIYNERRVELACEENRYFDVRRLHKSDEDLSKTDKWVTAANIIRNADGTFTYGRKQVNGKNRQCYSNKWLKCPIPLDEVNNIIALTGDNWQNPGW
ncbi:MAG: RagB/SusD family nutrient uptake outer membrane protein [Prevotella sp.]|jgi:hypothetical protein|nr:RagB/SusD family nutrient uptake outer membrane protein [Prevotella sp.]MCI1684439.1 RagB/SusD family nutrient uptake outer membrane protein [Prevotella sp.]MCI1781271.1 RagB/SusD family nutrient uptake outer membrane protein [Prevotella sp.]MCI1802530.1 RagB/SusD family nutrient uptake outer membrane protein [Prevotella sp.]